MGFFPPAGIEYIATAMRDHVGRVTVVDMRQDEELGDLDRLVEFARSNVDLMCVSFNWSYRVEDVDHVIDSLPKDIPLVVGGQYATDNVEDLFERHPNIDIIVRGEGEDTIQEVVQGKKPKDILGLSYRKNGSYVHNANRPLPPVTHYAPPDRSMRRTSYHIQSKGVKLFDGGVDTVLSSRGCPYNCKFCTFTINPLGQKRDYSARDPESVVDEIESIEADTIFFLDDNFFVNFNRGERICDLLIERGIKKKYMVQTRLEIYRRPAMLEKAAMAGFKVMLVGVESPHDRILELFNKGFTSAQARGAFATLTKYPFYFHCYFIFGTIGETEREMLYIPRFAQEIGADSISFQRFQVRKHSPLRDLMESTPGYHATPRGTVYSDWCTLEDRKRIRTQIRWRFYTFGKLVRIVRKLHQIGFLNTTDLLMIIRRAPALMYVNGARYFGKKWRRRGRKRRRKLAQQANA